MNRVNTTLVLVLPCCYLLDGLLDEVIVRWNFVDEVIGGLRVVGVVGFKYIDI